MSVSHKPSTAKKGVIVSAAARLFKEKGYRATTLEDIALAVGILKGSLYYYFQSKEELLYLVVREPICQAHQRLEEILNSDGPVKTKIAQAFANHLTLFHQHYPHIAVYLHDFHNLTEKLQQNATETPKYYQGLWTQLLRQGVESGELRPDIDVKITGYAMLGMCNWMYRWYLPQGAMSAEDIADLFTKLTLEGLTPQY